MRSGRGTHGHAGRMEAYHLSAGGQGRQVLSARARRAAQNNMGDIRAGRSWGRTPALSPGSLTHNVSVELVPAASPAGSPAKDGQTQGLEEFQQLQQ